MNLTSQYNVKMSEKQFIKAKHVLMVLVLILLLHLVLYMMADVKFKINEKQKPVLLQTFSKSKSTVLHFPSLLELMLEQSKAGYQTNQIIHLRAAYMNRNIYLRKWLILRTKGSHYAVYQK